MATPHISAQMDGLSYPPCTLAKELSLTALLARVIAHRLCKDGHLVLSGVSEEVGNMLSIQRFDPELIIESNLSDAEQKMKLKSKVLFMIFSIHQ